MIVGELAKRIGAEVVGRDGAAEREVIRCGRLEDAGSDEVAFLANQKYAAQLESTDAGAVIVAPGVECNGKTLLRAADPYFAFRNAVVALHGYRRQPTPADGPISGRAVVDPNARIGEGSVVHPFTVICQGVTIGRNCVIYPNVFIGPDVHIGDDCLLYPNVCVYDNCVLGDRVTLHAGTVVGQDGFGYATHEGAHHKIPQVGNVLIEGDVEMGANCSIDRATLGSTVIGRGTKFSDAVTIGHGCRIGKHNLMVAMVGIAGSVDTGDYVVMGGQVGVAGHLKIGDQAKIAASSGVMANIPAKGIYGGTPAVPLNDAKRQHLYAMKLPDILARLKKLERQIKDLMNDS